MRQFFLLFTLLVLPKLFFCQDLVIVGVGDGNYSKNTLKFVELYAKKAVDLNDYQIEIFSNGQTNATITIDLGKVTAPTEVAAGSRIFLRNGSDVSWNNLFNCENGFSSSRTIVKKAFVSFNGNDAIALALKTGQRIDLFGNIGEVKDKNDYSISWNYQDGWAYRIDATSADGNYTPAHWVIKSAVFPIDLSTSNCELGADKYPFATYILPIQFVDLSTSKVEERQVLNWSVYSVDEHIQSFEIEVSKDGRFFELQSVHLFEQGKANYSAILQENEQKLFYRVKANTAEKAYFSNILRIESTQLLNVGFVYHSHQQKIEQIGNPVFTTLYDLSGQVYHQTHAKYINVAHLKRGIYIIKTESSTQKLVVY